LKSLLEAEERRRYDICQEIRYPGQLVMERLICNVEMWGLPPCLLREGSECQQSPAQRELLIPIPKEHQPGLKLE